MRCPICKKPFDPETTPTRPFCSPRCREIDLGRWLGEQYAVSRETDEEGEEGKDEEAAEQ